MATTKCYIPVLGKRLRVTALDDCGHVLPPLTEDGFIVTDGFITVTLTAEVEEGNEIITKKASGALCVNEKQADSFKRFTIEIEFCGVNPSLLSMVTNAEPYLDYDNNIAGFTIGEGAIDKKFALELWTGLSGQACAPGAEASGYMLLPYINAGIVGDIEIDGENAVTFSMTGAYTKGGNGWGVGPYEVMNATPTDPTPTPAGLPTPLDPYDHFLLVDTDIAPPPDSCDAQPMPDVAATVPVAISDITAGQPATFTPVNADVPADLAAIKADPVVGDSAWSTATTPAWSTTGDYVELGDSSHAYWDGSNWVVGEVS